MWIELAGQLVTVGWQLVMVLVSVVKTVSTGAGAGAGAGVFWTGDSGLDGASGVAELA